MTKRFNPSVQSHDTFNGERFSAIMVAAPDGLYVKFDSVPSNPFDDIIEFHRAMVPDQVDLRPCFPSTQVEQLRVSLIEEEVNEELLPLINTALASVDRPKDLPDGNPLLAEIADAICDSIVVLIGTALAYGIPIQKCWDEVHRTNMAKIGGPVREDGKRLKPKGWTPPNLLEIIEKA